MRKGYWSHLYKGGLDTPLPSYDLLVGLGVHKGMEVLLTQHLQGNELSEEFVLDSAETEFLHVAKRHPDDALKSHLAHLVRGLVYGWIISRWDGFIEQFEIISVEKEVQALLAPNILLQARADAVVRDRESGLLWVFNWKTSSEKKDWTQKWMTDVQAWTEALATEEALGEKVQGCIFEGFYKGSKSNGFYSSPLVVGYKLGEGDQAVYSPTYERFSKEKPWKKFSPWLLPEWSQEGWIKFLPENLRSDLFPRSEPIFKNDEVVRHWLQQVVREQTNIGYVLEEGSEEERLIFFKQHFGPHCKWCPFWDACRQVTNVDSMVEAGLLAPRADHHLASLPSTSSGVLGDDAASGSLHPVGGENSGVAEPLESVPLQ